VARQAWLGPVRYLIGLALNVGCRLRRVAARSPDGTGQPTARM